MRCKVTHYFCSTHKNTIFFFDETNEKAKPSKRTVNATNHRSKENEERKRKRFPL